MLEGRANHQVCRPICHAIALQDCWLDIPECEHRAEIVPNLRVEQPLVVQSGKIDSVECSVPPSDAVSEHSTNIKCTC